MVMFEDEYFNTHKWIRVDGKPHWAYGTKYLILVKDRNELYWTPNTITSGVKINSDKANIKLNSYTPFFKTYQMKESPGGDWKDVPDSLEISLAKTKNEFFFRSMNQQGVAGAEHRVVIEQ